MNKNLKKKIEKLFSTSNHFQAEPEINKYYRKNSAWR